MASGTLPIPPARVSRWASSAAAERQNLETNALVARYLAGEERAFGEILQRYRPRLVAFIYRMIGDRERAEDLVQEAFIRIHRHMHRFDSTRKFSTWVYTIASNLAKNELRNRSRNPLVYYQSSRGSGDEDQRPLQFEDASSRPDDMYASRLLKELVDATVDRLSPHHREVFVLRELQGRSYEEIAAVTHCNLGTVKSRLNRARAGFAQMIAPYLD